MKIKDISLYPYENYLTTGQNRKGALIKIVDVRGNEGLGDIAPLPKWSRETLDDALQEISQKQLEIIKIDWTSNNCLKQLEKLNLLPSVLFGVESALLSILDPISSFSLTVSALLMGSAKEILQHAALRYHEGYTFAKLKIGHLSFEEAEGVIRELKDKFRLRIDVNKAWDTWDSLDFFERFPLGTFDYVEEPFRNCEELALFPHPLALDESFRNEISLEQLNSLPMLKAIIYKPTLQGGLLGCLPLYKWTKKQKKEIVLSSCFESEVGLAHIASMAHRLHLTSPIGIGTYHYNAG